MEMLITRSSLTGSRRTARPIATFVFGLALLLNLRSIFGAAETGPIFATPEQAVSALVAAASRQDENALQFLFGPAAADLENPDRVQATNEMNNFTAAYNQAHRLVLESESRRVLEVGPDSWPFPVPIVKKDNHWFFDTEAGKDEVLRRRVGKNELSTLAVMRAYVDAQREYASRDRDRDEVLEYAQKVASTPGRTDGLYWPPDLNGEISPLGPWVGQAQGEGYFLGGAGDAGPQPFHGYYFKILTQQGANAPGGKYSYIINGNMIGGFALVGWPAEYGESGVMTFVVNQQGRVYQKDLGERTDKVVNRMRAYDPDPSWQVSRD